MELHGSHGRDIFKKCLSGALFKETAEIFPADSQGTGSIVKCQWLAAVFFHPVHDLGDALEVKIFGCGVRAVFPFGISFI